MQQLMTPAADGSGDITVNVSSYAEHNYGALFAPAKFTGSTYTFVDRYGNETTKPDLSFGEDLLQLRNGWFTWYNLGNTLQVDKKQPFKVCMTHAIATLHTDGEVTVLSSANSAKQHADEGRLPVPASFKSPGAPTFIVVYED